MRVAPASKAASIFSLSIKAASTCAWLPPLASFIRRNLTAADVYFGRGQTILIERERIKRQTIANRRLMHR
jgi:hypothetical protein